MKGILQKFQIRRKRAAQSAIEYLVLLGVATAVSLWAFKFMLPRVRVQGKQVLNNMIINIVGDAPQLRTGGNYP